MILELTIGESITIRMDDDITDSRPVPEVVGDYLARMRQEAVQTYMDLPSASVTTGDDGDT